MKENRTKKENEPNNRIIVHNLSFKTEESGLREYFSKFGQVVDVEIPQSKENRSKGFGFVTFASVEEATIAIQGELHEIDEREVRTNFANKRENPVTELVKGKKLYIGKLPDAIDESELKEYFEKFGTVKDAFLAIVKYARPRNISGKDYPEHKGYGFVSFENEEDANKAVAFKNHQLKNTNIFVRKAIPQKDESDNRSKGGKNTKKNDRKDNKTKPHKHEKGENNHHTEKSSETHKVHQTTETPSSNQQQTEKPKENTNKSDNHSNEEKKRVVVLRKEQKGEKTNENNNKEHSNNERRDRERKPRDNKSKSPSNQNTTSSTKKTKAIVFVSESKSNPWKVASTGSQSQITQDFPTLGQKSVKNTNVSSTTPSNDDKGKEENN